MELIATEGSLGWQDPQFVFSRFRYGQWEGWVPPERHAVESYFVSRWRFVLSRYPVIPGWDLPWWSIANDYLCGIAQATDDPSPCLQMWRTDRSRTGLRHLADFVADTLDDVMENGTLGAWWKDRAAQAQVKEWLTDPATTQRLEEGMASPSCEPFAPSLSEALDHLAHFRKRTLWAFYGSRPGPLKSGNFPLLLASSRSTGVRPVLGSRGDDVDTIHG